RRGVVAMNAIVNAREAGEPQPQLRRDVASLRRAVTPGAQSVARGDAQLVEPEELLAGGLFVDTKQLVLEHQRGGPAHGPTLGPIARERCPRKRKWPPVAGCAEELVGQRQRPGAIAEPATDDGSERLAEER